MEIKKILKDKRGLGIRDLYPTILTIVVVAILLGIVFMVLAEWISITNNEIGSIYNETNTTTVTNASVGTVSTASVCGFEDFTIIRVTNASDGVLMDSGNYTIVSTTEGTWKLTDEAMDGEDNYSSKNLTYTYVYGGADCEAVEDIIDDFTDFIPWIGIILLVIAAAIILGLVITSFAGRKGV